MTILLIVNCAEKQFWGEKLKDMEKFCLAKNIIFLYLSAFNSCIIVVYMLQYNESVSGSNYRKSHNVR